MESRIKKLKKILKLSKKQLMNNHLKKRIKVPPKVRKLNVLIVEFVTLF